MKVFCLINLEALYWPIALETLSVSPY